MAKAKAKTFAGEKPEAWLKAARHIGKTGGGYLIGHEITYRAAVEAVATILRPRFESGELRGWRDSDGDKCGPLLPKRKQVRPPYWRIGDACRDLFIRSETAAFVVLTWASPTGKREAEWFDVMGKNCRLPSCALDTAAGEAMAHDVLAFARRRGWLRTTRRAA